MQKCATLVCSRNLENEKNNLLSNSILQIGLDTRENEPSEVSSKFKNLGGGVVGGGLNGSARGHLAGFRQAHQKGP